jgi:lipopolysaccharide transport system permease protein
MKPDLKSVINSEEQDNSWDLVIRPKRHLLDINLKEVWEYRDLIALFVRRDFVAKNKRSLVPSGSYLIRLSAQ